MASLSIKNVPDALVKSLRVQAARNHRSLQGELLRIVAESIEPEPFDGNAYRVEMERLGLFSQGDSVAMVREDRDRAGDRR